MTRAAMSGCTAIGHDHLILVHRRPIARDDRPGGTGLLTLWLCPVLHVLGAIWEDTSRRPEDLTPGGPLP